MKTNLLVFASDDKYIIPSNRLINQAKKINVFDNIIFIQPNSFPNYFKDFINSNKDFIENNSRGYGYWIWKSFLINWQLHNALEENDILVYLDSGCEISSHGKNELLSYINLAHKNGGVFFNTKFKEKFWTKMDLVHYLESTKLLNSKQIQATFFLIKNTSDNRKLTSKWIEISMLNNYHFLDDTISCSKNVSGFVEHRHDQSILSLLVKNNNYHIIDCDYFFGENLYFLNSYVLKFPIHALRNIQIESRLNNLVRDSDFKNINSFLSFIRFNILIFWNKKKHQLYKLFVKIFK